MSARSTTTPLAPGADNPVAAAPDEAADRTEKVIALSRLALSVFALCVVILDPRQPMYSSGALYFLLAAYILYSAALLVFVGSRGARGRLTSKPILVADIAWYTAIVGLGEGGTSPFFLLYLFAVCTAAIRWGVRTTIRVSLWSAALYLVGILVVRRVVLGPDFTLHTAHLFRPVYLVVLGYLVGLIGEQELSAKRRILELVAMQGEVGRSRSQLFTLARLFRRIVRFFGADYVLLQIRPPDGAEIDWEGARKAGQRLVLRTTVPTPWSPEFASERSYRVSHAIGNWGRRVEMFEPGTYRPSPLPEGQEPGFLARSRLRSLMSVPITSPGGYRGRLLLGRARANFSRDDVAFCQTLVAQATVILDNVSLQAKAEELAVAEERARIARDIHDGFVQALASIDVGIEVCRRLDQRNPARLTSELAELQRTVKQGYREARRYLDRLRQRTPQGPAVEVAMHDLVREFQERGDLQVDLHAAAAGMSSRDGIGFEVLQIVREGLTNIVRHAGAAKASILVEARNGTVEVVIRDDGRGFPAAAESSSEEIPLSAAPWSIRDRVASLGGTLKLTSVVGRGSEIRITLPRAGE
ncbi:MAG TPA: GAF domain-containing sensor histidine kinase [Candidatus Binatia bacterium]|nr:GAF domain-containing sensor histidine kinase [Candidatus Binatia bacterium]